MVAWFGRAALPRAVLRCLKLSWTRPVWASTTLPPSSISIRFKTENFHPNLMWNEKYVKTGPVCLLEASSLLILPSLAYQKQSWLSKVAFWRKRERKKKRASVKRSFCVESWSEKERCRIGLLPPRGAFTAQVRKLFLFPPDHNCPISILPSLINVWLGLGPGQGNQ